ncbi:MAG: hypothetical protein WBO70_07805 [Erysipelotrichaceae bacterium]
MKELIIASFLLFSILPTNLFALEQKGLEPIIEYYYFTLEETNSTKLVYDLRFDKNDFTRGLA